MEFVFLILLLVGAVPLGLAIWIGILSGRVRALEETLRSLSQGAFQKLPARGAPVPQVQEEVSHAQEEIVAPELAREPFVPTPSIQEEKVPFNWEALFGGKAFVWLGALALAFAGFYLVKYSIEANLIGPRVRLSLGFVFGLSLLVGADQVRKHPALANGIPISQGLSGAGLVALYSVFYAAAKLYDLLPMWGAFTGMACVTGVAVILSLRFGMPIAIMGLVGGFLTPFFLESDTPSALSLFGYLYVLVAAMSFVAYGRGWTLLLALIPVGAFAWVVVWHLSDLFVPGDGMILSGFLVATALTNMFFMLRTREETFTSIGSLHPSILTKAILVVSFLMMASLMDGAFYSDVQWGLLWLLCAGTVAMAFFDEARFFFVLWAALATVACMFLTWISDDGRYFLTTLAFGALFSVGGRLLMSRATDPRPWAAMNVGVSLGWFVLVYLKVGEGGLFDGIPYFWSILAFGFAAVSAFTVSALLTHVPKDHPHKEILLGLYVFGCAAFLALGLFVALPGRFLPLALSGLMALLGYVNTRVPLKHTPFVMTLLGAACVISLFWDDALYVLGMNVPQDIALWPSMTLALPALFFGASLLMVRGASASIRLFFGSACLLLATTAAYIIVRKAFNGFLFDDVNNWHLSRPDFLERGFLNQIFFILSIALFWGARRWSFEGARRAGEVMMIIAFGRVILFDLLQDFPLFAGMDADVGSAPLFNGLLLTYFAPVLWSVAAHKLLQGTLSRSWEKFYKGAALFLTFVWVSLTVRHLFHGGHISLEAALMSDGEIYTYSAVWILVGVGYLLLGMVRKDHDIRIASLPVMLISIGKVFFYDASSLTGLTRALSFLVLGLVLLALSWFYTRFVFTKADSKI
ncbi:MAG: hypothetical protein C0514_03805 [Candidatus Puniceispirillum sp.]|nr:hypothetical protein [Candidatus Puniceispirillum sp.]